ncbi:MAG: DUF4328 domain-containing protein, partial [Actinomycetota bacterium]|nr:DUF4328 domain-containing protein [Actinomycetota bacterium]
PPPAPSPEEVSAGGAAWPSSYQSVQTIGNVLSVILVLVLLVDVVAVISDMAEYSLLGRIQSGEFVSDREATASDIRQGALGLLQSLLIVVSIVMWLIWFRRAYKNLVPLQAGAPRFKPGWAIGAWFVPFLNLWRPLQMTKDVWNGSAPSAARGPPLGGWAGAGMPPLLGFWWLFFIVANAAYPGFGEAVDATSIADLRGLSLRFVIADSLSVVLDILAIAVVRGITSRQEQRAATLATQPTAAG